MIAILDYGVGNLFSLRSSLQQLGLQAVVTADADTIRAADRLILPGVGAFGDAMAKLTATGLVPVLKEQAEQKPLLGICLGMQLLFEKSYEYGEHAGLGFIKGEVCPLGPDLADKGLKVPQMGWNALHIVKDDPLFRYIREGEYVYYVHSYYGKNCAESTLAVSDYSIPVTGAVRAGRVYGTQFHPEKSGDTGLRILKAFSGLSGLAPSPSKTILNALRYRVAAPSIRIVPWAALASCWPLLNNSSLFPPLAAVVVVALWAYSAEKLFLISRLSQPAPLSNTFFRRGS